MRVRKSKSVVSTSAGSTNMAELVHSVDCGPPTFRSGDTDLIVHSCDYSLTHSLLLLTSLTSWGSWRPPHRTILACNLGSTNRQANVFFHLLQPCSLWTTRRTLPVSGGRSASVGFYWQNCSACEGVCSQVGDCRYVEYLSESLTGCSLQP